jgi:hypothetical protein
VFSSENIYSKLQMKLRGALPVGGKVEINVKIKQINA